MEQPETTPAAPVAAPTPTPEAATTVKAPAAKAPARAPKARAEGGSNGAPALRATGRRKEAIAQVRLVPGPGVITVNSKPYDQYFSRETLRLTIRQPLILTHQFGKQNVIVRVVGGGHAGQAGAIRLGIARALLSIDPALRPVLRSNGFLTRDPRAKERKKYGQKGARKRFQWTKR